MSSVKPKIFLLDTNIWRYLSDSNLASRLLGLQKKLAPVRKIAVAPTSVYEIEKLQDEELKTRILKIVCNPIWYRFPTDRFIMCEQLFSEIKAIRPDWLINAPETPTYDALCYAYKRRRGGWWDISASRAGFGSWEQKEDFYRQSDEEKIDISNKSILEGKRFKEATREKELKQFKTTPYKDLTLTIQLRENEWITSEHWVVESLQLFWIWHKGGARDWLFERVNLNFLSKNNPDYIKFWEKVRAERLSSLWLRSFFGYKGMLRKMNFGTGADQSLSTYCIHADYFVSADRVFVDILSEAKDEADFRIATPILIKGGQDGISDFIRDFSSGSTFS